MNFDKYQGLFYIDSSCEDDIINLNNNIKQNTINLIKSLNKFIIDDDYILLLYNKKYIKNNQILLYKDKNIEYNSKIILSIFDNQKDYNIYSIYLILENQWNSIPTIKLYYKAIRLNLLLTIYQSDNNIIIPLSQSNLENNIIRETTISIQDDNNNIVTPLLESNLNENSITKKKIKVNKKYFKIDTFFIGNLHNYNKNIQEEEEENSFMCRYVNLLFDYSLYLQNFPNDDELKTQIIEDYINFINYNENRYYHSHYMIQFIHYIMKYTKIENKGKSFIYNDINCLFSEEWKLLELSLFEYSKNDININRFFNIVKNHIIFIKDKLHNSRYPNWFDYYINDNDNDNEESKTIIWKKENNLFKIRFEWLLKGGSHEVMDYKKLEKGYIYIDEEIFRNKFISILYKLMLNDILIYMYHLTFFRDSCFFQPLSDDWLHYEDYISEKWFNFHFNDIIQYKDDLFSFIIKHNHHTSPLMKNLLYPILIKEELNEQYNKNIINNNTFERVFYPIPDIEDLFNIEKSILPPCIKPILKQDHIKHFDRLNFTKYLIDIGYNLKEIKNKILKHYPEVEENEIEAIYKTDMKNRLKKEKPTLSCSAIMKYKPDNGNNIRCPFEQKINGQIKKELSDSDKINCMSECLINLKKETNYNGIRKVFHPIDYMIIKNNK